MENETKALKKYCASCDECAAIFSCRGCAKSFCLKHTNEHRHELDRIMHKIVEDFDRVNGKLSEPRNDKQREIIDEIGLWEENSIKKIRQAAEDMRREVADFTQDHDDRLNEKLTELSKSLRTAQRSGEYFEKDLEHWDRSIKRLNELVQQTHLLSFKEDKQQTPLIGRMILLRNGYMKKSCANENVYHRLHTLNKETNLSLNHAYIEGSHILRFKLNHFGPEALLLIGIASSISDEDQNEPLSTSFYGWSNKSEVYRAGVLDKTTHYTNDIHPNDTFQMTIMCEKTAIRLINERTQQLNQLDVDLDRCPFPWKPHVRLLLNP